MNSLPLFPLNTVLFPGMPLSLHIFEERYKLMIGRCIERREPFGVVALKQGSDVEDVGHQEVISYLVGCTAQITQVQRLVEGRMNIVAVGHERFRIEAFDRQHPYLVGIIQRHPMEMNTVQEVEKAGQKLRPWVERYLVTLGRADNLQFDMEQMPKEPLALAYLSASLLRIAVDEKQDLLVSPSAVELIERLRQYYRKEVALLDAQLATDKMKGEGPFSLN